MNYQTQLEPQLVSRMSSINSSISLMVNWWFGFVGGLDSERIPLWREFLLVGTPRFPNHRAPNHLITNHLYIYIKKTQQKRPSEEYDGLIQVGIFQIHIIESVVDRYKKHSFQRRATVHGRFNEPPLKCVPHLKFQMFFIFTTTWGRSPFWVIFFKWVETTN